MTAWLEFIRAAEDATLALPYAIPLGAVGIWRWSMWLAKRVPAQFYRPIENNHTCSATVIAAVYAENPALFRRALESWLANEPNAITVVVQGTDLRCADVAREYSGVKVIELATPHKRQALVAGVDICRTDIAVLADSDAIWEPDVLRKLKMPFADPKIGGVGTRQYMHPTNGPAPTLWERIADIFLSNRYADEVAATTRWGRAVSCLSGRTAAYRTTLLRQFREAFLNERFNGKPCISGDDKCYTSLVLRSGYSTWTQLSATVHSTFQPGFSGFVRQRIRWSRNTHRSDLQALGSRWVWRHPYLAVLMLDKMVAPFTQTASVALFVMSVVTGTWKLVAVQLTWWHLTRAIKMWPHLRRRPNDWILLPVFIAATIYTSLIKIYALLTLDRHEWLTRPAAADPVASGATGPAPAAARG